MIGPYVCPIPVLHEGASGFQATALLTAFLFFNQSYAHICYHSFILHDKFIAAIHRAGQILSTQSKHNLLSFIQN